MKLPILRLAGCFTCAFLCASSATADDAFEFLQVKSEVAAEALAKNGPLWVVAVNYEWKKYNPEYGVTIEMDSDTAGLKMLAGINTKGPAVTWGYMKDEISTNGWAKFYVEQTENSRISNDVRMYASGFMEGLLTATRISQFYFNFYQTMLKDEDNGLAIGNIRKVCQQEIDYVMQNSNLKPGVISVEPMDPYWKHMRYQLLQLWGMKEGYNFAAMGKGVRTLDLVDFVFINAHAELPELMMAYTPKAIAERKHYQANVAGKSFFQQKIQNITPSAPHEHATSRRVKPRTSKQTLLAKGSDGPPSHVPRDAKEADADWEDRMIKHGHCSALVRVTSENKDIMAGHTTWGDYCKMLRIFKYYHFKLPGAYTKAEHIGMSSYPGCISSTDDYYELSSGLVVMDTSLEILNTNLYKRIAEFPVNSHVPDFMHVMTANRMASTAPHWVSLFSDKNSGTDNAQWMILDYNRFVPGKPVPDNTFWVLEQIPGMMKHEDMTWWIRDKGYWGSYNRPYFKEIRDMSGHTAAEATYGALYSYDGNPRASIMKSIVPLAEHLMDMRSILNRNAWPGEGVLPSEPGHAISARMDLAFSKIPNGGIDAKIVNRCLFRSLQCQAISGPTHDSQPVFKWKDGAVDVMAGWPHMGQPDVYDFDWVQMTPTKQLEAIVDIDDCKY